MNWFKLFVLAIAGINGVSIGIMAALYAGSSLDDAVFGSLLFGVSYATGVLCTLTVHRVRWQSWATT